jgi:hypothetical protein
VGSAFCAQDADKCCCSVMGEVEHFLQLNPAGTVRGRPQQESCQGRVFNPAGGTSPALQRRSKQPMALPLPPRNGAQALFFGLGQG